MTSNLSSGGYDFNFVTEPPDELKCLICLAVARDPRQHEECGKLFCNGCIEMHGKNKPCPNCKKTGVQFYKDHRSKRNISELQVKCDNVEKGCEWVGTVGTLQKHVDTCEFALIPCPKECKTNNQVCCFMRRLLKNHLEKDCPNRDYTCEHCGEEGTYVSITHVHDKTCQKKVLPCPNESCPDTMQRQHIKEHVDIECEYTRTPCKYRRLGCETELIRKDMAAHEEDDKLHLHMAIDKTVELEKNLKDVTTELEGLKDFKRTLRNGEPIKFKLTGFQKKKENNQEVQSPSYYISPNGYHMVLNVEPNGCGDYEDTHISVYAYILEGRYDADLKWPFVGKITFTLLNQLEDKNHYQRRMEFEKSYNIRAGGIAWGLDKFTPHSKLGHDPVRNIQYLKDDTLYFRMEVEVADRKSWLE